jgi:hypothetical protein
MLARYPDSYGAIAIESRETLYLSVGIYSIVAVGVWNRGRHEHPPELPMWTTAVAWEVFDFILVNEDSKLKAVEWAWLRELRKSTTKAQWTTSVRFSIKPS